MLTNKRQICFKYINLHRYASSTTNIIIKGELPSLAYKPEVVEKIELEDDIYKADNASNKPRFSIVLPPPNITGKLHLGHALTCTIQDVIVRRKRGMGHNVLWLPGKDHAGIATQGVVEKYLATQNINRAQLGRENFINEVWKWKDKYGENICNQLKMLGTSLDWTKLMFTMDPTYSKSVGTAFIRLYNKGLIYRKKALVNWCPKLKSTISDIEVESMEINSPTDLKVDGYDKPVRFGLMYEFAYKVCDSNEEVVVSTTLPETMLGDTAVAINPLDERYKHLRNKQVLHPFTNKTIPIIFDDFVDMNFGTGVVKITPAHSKIDYEVSMRHNIPLTQVIEEDGTMVNAFDFNGMNKYECREKIVEKLDSLGLLRKIGPHQMKLPICSRTGSVIEYLPKEQWFVSCESLNRKATEIVKNGSLKIEPEKFIKNWFDWTEDSRDWCISRQLWWGHRIPAYKCSVGEKTVWVAAMNDEEARNLSGKLLDSSKDNVNIERDTDVLDTWFSSGIYPFASLGWPECNENYQKYYPLNLLVTGHDILGFWVHRMVILGLELTGEIPFNKVLLHGVVCDSKGAKMSKSKGNVVDPIDVIKGISMADLNKKIGDMYKDGTINKEELDKTKAYNKSNYSNTNGIPECGVDALRFTLLSSDVKSHYVHFDLDLCHTNKLFCNKIWQSVKYTQFSFEKLAMLDDDININDLSQFDKWILSKMTNMIRTVNDGIENHNFHKATKCLKTFLYNEFCDFYLEATKPGFDSDDFRLAYAHAHTLSAILNTSLRCLAPFMVHLTKTLIPVIPAFEHNIICNYNDDLNNLSFPLFEDFKQWHNAKTELDIDKLINLIFLVRQIKGIYGISNKMRPKISINTTDDNLVDSLNINRKVALNLTRTKDILFESNSKFIAVTGVLTDDTQVSIEVVGDDVNNIIKVGKSKLAKKISKLKEVIDKMESKFPSNYYANDAPESKFSLGQDKLKLKKEEMRQLERLLT